MEDMEETNAPDSTVQLLLVLDSLDKVTKALTGMGAKVDSLTEKVDTQGMEIKTLKEKSPPPSPTVTLDEKGDTSDA